MESANVQLREPPRGVTFEDVWASMRETDRMLKEMGAETDRQLKENAQQMKETDRRMAETDRRMAETDRRMAETDRRMAETDRRIKETQRIVGSLGNRFGDIAEQFLLPALPEKFKDFGFSFGEVYRNVKWKNESCGLSMELDALLGNGGQAMVVEVKARLDKADVDDQAERMENVRRYADLRGDARQFYCAVATMSADERVIAYALSKGFFLIMPSGEDVKVTKPASEPRFW